MASAGMELLFNSVKHRIHAPQDSVLCVLHWEIVSSGYKCMGIGETAIKGSDEETEMLPEGWNITPDLYVLRYKLASTGDFYVLKVIAVDGVLLVHFWKSGEDDRVITMNVEVDHYANEDFSTYKKALKHVTDLKKDFKTEILDVAQPVTSRATDSSRMGSNSDERTDEDDDPLRVPGTGNRRRIPNPTPPWQDPNDPFSVGRSDIDPLGAGSAGMGGGMYFDPMRGGQGPRFGMDPSAGLPNRLPPGAVQPGARFDPFGPPGTHPGQRPGPDPDHLRPPDYDDMYM